MVRGIEKRLIFVDDADRFRFLERLGTVVRETRVRCLAFAIMPNHVHLVLKTGHQRLGTLMQRVFTGYAMRFNGRSGRRGHLLEGRFGSRAVRDEGDLLIVIRYVLRNPLAAGLSRDLEALERYPWGGLGALVGRSDLTFRRGRFAA